MRRKKILAILLVLCAGISLCGAGWFGGTEVTIDTKKHPVYRYYTAEDVISAFEKDKNAAREQYHKEYAVLTGTIKAIGKDGKNITLRGSSRQTITIDCTYDKELRSTALQYQVGKSVALYGCFSIDFFDKEIHLKTEQITKVPAGITSKETYFLADGTLVDKTELTAMSLNNGGVTYYIPESWKAVSHNLREENLGDLEGYQYVLNQLEGDPGAAPESLFICYFNNKEKLDNKSDPKETELIEAAIVENILGSVGSFPSEKVTTYYDETYEYYLGSFRNPLEAGEGYHTEFVFRADGTEGIVVVLYVYKEAKHLGDIMYFMRFLEVN